MKPVMYKGNTIEKSGRSIFTSFTENDPDYISYQNYQRHHPSYQFFLFSVPFFFVFLFWGSFPFESSSLFHEIVTSSEESKTLESVGGFISYADKQVERNSQFTLSTNAPLSPL